MSDDRLRDQPELYGILSLAAGLNAVVWQDYPLAAGGCALLGLAFLVLFFRAIARLDY